MRCFLGFHKWIYWDKPFKLDDGLKSLYYIVKYCGRCRVEEYVPSVVNDIE